MSARRRSYPSLRSTDPDPAQQMRTMLAAFRRSGARPEDFERCWRAAWSRLLVSHRTDERRAWYRALAWSKPEWHAAWLGTFTDVSAAASTYAEAA